MSPQLFLIRELSSFSLLTSFEQLCSILGVHGSETHVNGYKVVQLTLMATCCQHDVTLGCRLGYDGSTTKLRTIPDHFKVTKLSSRL